MEKLITKPKWIPSEEELKKAERLSSQGMTQAQIADCLGIGDSCYYQNKRENQEFAEAIKRGKAKGIARVTRDLLKNVKKGNVTAQIFYLKTQAGWVETRHDPVENENGSLLEKLIDKL